MGITYHAAKVLVGVQSREMFLLPTRERRRRQLDSGLEAVVKVLVVVDGIILFRGVHHLLVDAVILLGGGLQRLVGNVVDAGDDGPGGGRRGEGDGAGGGRGAQQGHGGHRLLQLLPVVLVAERRPDGGRAHVGRFRQCLDVGVQLGVDQRQTLLVSLADRPAVRAARDTHDSDAFGLNLEQNCKVFLLISVSNKKCVSRAFKARYFLQISRYFTLLSDWLMICD